MPHPSRTSRALRVFSRRHQARRRLVIEPLEDRSTPATFAGAGGPGLNVILDNPNEAITIISNATSYTIISTNPSVDGGNTNGGVTGFGTNNATISAIAYQTINITDASTGAVVTFGNSGTNNYTTAFHIILDNPTARGLTFTGASTFLAGLTANVTGNIGGFGAGSVVAIEPVSLSSTTGSIILNNPANNFDTLSLQTKAGIGGIDIHDADGITLDQVSTALASASFTAGGDISQTTTGRFDVANAANFTFTAANSNLRLADADNFIGGLVTVLESGVGDAVEVHLRNVSPTASLPDLSLLAAGDLNVLDLIFDGKGIALDAATETTVAAGGELDLTAGGPITQTGPITVGTLNVTALGNNGITLTNPANNVTGTVSLNNPDADGGTASAVAYLESAAVNLGVSKLGLGTLSVTALSGNITESGNVTQRLGAGAARFAVRFGTAINLGTNKNLFAGSVRFLGANVTDVLLEDVNTLAALPDLSDVSDTLANLTLRFNNAPVVLPSYTLASLDVAADGVYQQPGTALVVSGNAHFNSSNFKIDLTNPANDFSTLQLISTGPEDVSVVDVDDLAFGGGNTALGTGRLTVTAGGPITQPANRIRQSNGAGPASLTAPSITLDQAANDFVGEVLLNTPGTATIADNSSIVLGRVTVGGSLAVTAAGDITQLAGSTLGVGSLATFDSGPGGAITLDNPGNTLTSVRFTDGNVLLRNSAAVNFDGASTVASLQVSTGGSIGQFPGSSLIVTGATILDAGANNVVLRQLTNDFQGPVGISSTGAAIVLFDANAVQIGDVKLGAGQFVVSANGNITQAANTGITQTGPGTVDLASGAANDVLLDQVENDFRGSLAVNANAVTVRNRGDVTFTQTSDIDGNLTIDAGGTLTLPTAAGNLTDLDTVSISAARTIVGANFGTNGGTGVSFHGAVDFAANVIVTTSASTLEFSFDGDVTAAGPLTFNLATESLDLIAGTWNQGANNLTVNSTGEKGLGVGDASGAPATFIMSGGTLALHVPVNRLALEVALDGTFQVGTSANSAEIVTLDTGGVGAGIFFDAGSTMQVGLGATNDKLNVNGPNSVLVAGANLIGSGAAGTTSTPVLAVTGGGSLFGAFTDSLAPDGTPQAFLAGSDIVTAAYLPASVSIEQGGPAPAGSFSGFLPDGDKYTVTHSGGAAAGLVVIENSRGQIDVAVRNNTGAGTLTISTTKFSGDGLTEVGGIGVNGPGSLTINAATANVRGDIRIEGALSSLAVRDVLDPNSTNRGQQILAGGSAATSTTIVGHEFDGVRIAVGGVLNKLTVASYLQTVDTDEPSEVTAERFGTISVTGDPANNLSGDLNARLTNRNTLNAPAALASASVAGQLSNTWDLAGSVGTVKSGTTNSWSLGSSGAGARHPDGVTAATSLTVGSAFLATVSVAGALGSFKATNLIGAAIRVGSVGTLSVVADPTNLNAGIVGNADNVSLTVTGNSGGTAINTLSVAGSLNKAEMHFVDGNVGTFTVGRELSNSNIVADATAAGGRFNAITAGRWNNTDLDANSVGTFKVVGNATAGLLGDVVNSDFTIRGNAAGLGIGILAVAGKFDTDHVVVLNGGITSLTAAREVNSSSILLSDPTLGNLTTLSAARWQVSTVAARTIGTFKVTGAAQTAPASPLLVGDVVGPSSILAYLGTGTTPGIGTFSVAGETNLTNLTARNGITSLKVAHAINGGIVVADNRLAAQPNVGRINTLSVGLWGNLSLTATTLGRVSITGFTLQDGTNPTKVPGSMASGSLLANGASTTGIKSGIDSLLVAGSMFSNPEITARSGIGALTVRGTVDDATLTFDNPQDIAGTGKVGTVSVGKWLSATIRANTLGTLKTVPSPIDFATGEFLFATVTVAGSSGLPTDPVAITSLNVANDMRGNRFNVPSGVKSFKVAGTVLGSLVAAGFGPNARIAALTAGAWINSDLTTRALSAMSVPGNAARFIAGDVTDSLLTVMGNSAGVGLGTFTAQGTISNSTVQVTDGSVVSFAAGKFLDSALYVGFRPNSSVDLSRGGTFSATDRTIGSFKTTQAFDPNDPDSVSFRNSQVVAADLGTMTLLGVDSDAARPFQFGIGFKVGGAAGSVKVNVGAGLQAISAPFTDQHFQFLGL